MSAPLRILLIAFNQVGRGTYWRAFHFGRCLAANGHAVTLLATAPRARWQSRSATVQGVQVMEMPDLLPGALRSGWDPWSTVRRLNWVRRRQFDIVHAFEARPVVIYPALAAQQRGARLIMDWCDWFGRGGSVEERPSAVQRMILRHVDTYYEEHFRRCAAGTTVINRFLEGRAAALGVPPQTILLLRNGADTTRPVMTRDAARREVGLPADGPLLGYVGSIYQRDAGLLAQTFERVRAARPAARLLLVGYFNRDLEGMLGSAHGIIRTGPVPAKMISAFLSAVDVCLLPMCDTGTNRGRWPFKLSDYMSVGRPTVATAVGDLPEVMGAYQLGPVTLAEPAALAEGVLALLDDERRRAEFGRAARAAAEGAFRWEQLTLSLEALYQRAMGG